MHRFLCMWTENSQSSLEDRFSSVIRWHDRQDFPTWTHHTLACVPVHACVIDACQVCTIVYGCPGLSTGLFDSYEGPGSRVWHHMWQKFHHFLNIWAKFVIYMLRKLGICDRLSIAFLDFLLSGEVPMCEWSQIFAQFWNLVSNNLMPKMDLQ